MIRRGEHPEEDPPDAKGTNKFLGFKGEGHRGILVALSKDRRHGVIVSMTESRHVQDGIHWGALYLIEASSDEDWPRAVKELTGIPDEQGMEILTP